MERLIAAVSSHQTPAPETVQWMRSTSDALHERLSRAGLCEPRQYRRTVGSFCDAYLAERADQLKPKSLAKLRLTAESLKASIGADKPLHKVTHSDATAWRTGLITGGMSEASAKSHTGNAKQILREAVRRKLIDENPFDHLRSGSTASKYTHFVTSTQFARFLEALPDDEWRLMFALARWAGLRVPSESHLLTWADVDWHKGRLFVRSPKTEHHEGHESRSVPIDPRLMEILRRAFEQAEEGSSRLVRITGNGYIAEQFEKAIRLSGVETWKRPFQTLRSSCEKEWAMSFPQYAVSRWIGHSLVVSGRHYANSVPDELFDKAAGLVAVETPDKAMQNPMHGDAISDAANARTQSHVEPVGAKSDQKCPEERESHDLIPSRAISFKVVRD
jgi:integrase